MPLEMTPRLKRFIKNNIKLNKLAPERRTNKQPENELQISCVNWFRYQYSAIGKLLFAVPNAGKRGRVNSAKMKASGVTSGVSDLILLTRSKDLKYGSLCIEMKYGKGVQSEKQTEWQKLTEKNGNKYIICNSFDQFKKEIEDYLKC